MSIPPPPRPREHPLGERLTALLPSRRGFPDGRSARANLQESAERLRASDGNPQALRAEAAHLDQAGVERVREFALAKPKRRRSVLEESRLGYLGSFQLCWPEVFEEAFLPPADAVYASYRRLVAATDPFDRYVRDSCVPTVGGWYEACPELVRAGELRLDAAKALDYPADLCRSCHRLGWVSASGRCDYCLWAERAAGLMSTGGVFGWRDEQACLSFCARYDQAAVAEYRHVLRGAGPLPLWPFGRKRQHYQIERVNAWGKVVHDISSDWGPAAPEDGYELWVPERFELEAIDGSAILVHFRATRHRWQRSGFLRLERKLRQHDLAAPSSFSATLEPSSLASAWYDFRLAVADVNSCEWLARVAREQGSQAAREHERERQDVLATQRGTAQILQV